MITPELPESRNVELSNVMNRRELLSRSGAMLAGSAMAATSGVVMSHAVSGVAAAGSTAAASDVRLGDLNDLNGYFPFQPSATPEEWERRREYVRRQILVSTGLWPMPERPTIKPTVHGRVVRDGYTVDRVYFESFPGFLVTGSLYLPAQESGATTRKLPTILCPHGHWPSGRFHDHGPDQITKEIASGGEQFEISGRHPLQARCVQLARMGCMVFLYDMLGYADGGSLSEDLAHRFNTQRPHLITPENWGLFSAQSELRLVNILGLQTWNSIRVLDWLSSREDCDQSRIGVTGASGGGTQTFLLTAVDDRVTAAFPAVMVSTAMQGGCTCENASYLRVNTGNIEFAAMAAPRPIAMTGANDWTVDIETKGLPELKKHYAMLGVPDRVAAKHYPFPHNYNWPSRMMMYRFFNKYLSLGLSEDAIQERDYIPLTRDEATVFGDGHPAPPRDEASEVRFLKAWDSASQKQIAAMTPVDSSSLKDFRRVIGGAFEIMIGRGLSGKDDIVFENESEEDKGHYRKYTGTLNFTKKGEVIPVVFLEAVNWNKKVVLWIDGKGKAAIFNQDGSPIPEVAKLLKAGFAVGSVDVLYTGDHTENGQALTESRRVNNKREFAGFTLGYNHPLFAQRTHDVLSLISFTRHHPKNPESILVMGAGGAGPVAASAVAMAEGSVSALAVDTQGFRFGSITDIRDLNLLPGAVKYGDLPAVLALCPPARLCVSGETADSASVTKAACQSAGTELKFVDSGAMLAEWLLG